MDIDAQKVLIELQNVNTKLKSSVDFLKTISTNIGPNAKKVAGASAHTQTGASATETATKKLIKNLNQMSIGAGEVIKSLSLMKDGQDDYTKATLKASNKLRDIINSLGKTVSSTNRSAGDSRRSKFSDKSKVKEKAEDKKKEKEAIKEKEREKQREKEKPKQATRDVPPKKWYQSDPMRRRRVRHGRDIKDFTGKRHAIKSTVGDAVLDKIFGNGSILTSLTTLAGSFALLSSGASGLLKEFHALRTSGFQYDVITISKNALAMGVSLEALTKIIDASKSEVNNFGLEGFIKTLKDSQNGLMALGMTTDEANKFAANAVISARNAGISAGGPGDSAQLINQQKETYAAMRATTSITTDQFQQMNDRLINSNDTQEVMAQMDETRKRQYQASILLEERRMTIYQLSADQQEKILNTLNNANRGTFVNRAQAGAKFNAFLSSLGMGAQGARAQQLKMKGDQRLTPEERAELNTINIEASKRLNAALGGTYEQENNANVMAAQLDPKDLAAVKEANAVNVAVAAGKKLTPEQEKEKIARGNDSPLTVSAIKAGSIFQATVTNSLVKILIGLGGIAFQLGLVNMSLGRGFFGKLGKFIPGFGAKGTGLMRGGSMMARAGMFGGSIIGGVKSLGSKALGLGAGGVKVAGTAARTLGKVVKFVPIVGTAIAAVMGIFDAFSGWQDAGKVFETDAPNFGQKISSAIGSVVSGLTLGLIDSDTIAKGLYSIGDSIASGLGAGWDYIWGKITGVGSRILSFFGITSDLGTAPVLPSTAKAKTSATIASPVVAKNMPIGSKSATINSLSAQDKAELQGLTNDSAARFAASESVTTSSTSTVNKKEVTIADLFDKLVELIDVSGDSLGISKEQLLALKGLNKDSSMTASDFVS